MRPVMHTDLIHAARAMLCVQDRARGELIERLLQEADRADRFRKRLGRAHPKWGNGTLAGAASQYDQRSEPLLSDVEYRECLSLVLQSLTSGLKTN